MPEECGECAVRLLRVRQGCCKVPEVCDEMRVLKVGVYNVRAVRCLRCEKRVSKGFEMSGEGSVSFLRCEVRTVRCLTCEVRFPRCVVRAL